MYIITTAEASETAASYESPIDLNFKSCSQHKTFEGKKKKHANIKTHTTEIGKKCIYKTEFMRFEAVTIWTYE